MDREDYILGTKRNYDSDGSPEAANYIINNDVKKVKLAGNDTNQPSRVLHIGNLPHEVSEAEIIHLGNPFGRVKNILVLKGKNQAFLEMTDEIAAATMVNYFANTSAHLRGRQVFIQYSNHKELKTDASHLNAIDLNNSGLFQDATIHDIDRTETQGGPNTILRVIVDNMLHTVTLDVLHTIFSRIGKVLKIITFTKNNTYHALVQFADASISQAAKEALDGQNIYNSCCNLRIDYSKLTNLSIRYNNDKSRDYTNPGLPSGDPSFGSTAGILSSPFAATPGLGKSSISHNSSIMGDMPLGGGFSTGAGKQHSALATGCVLIVSNLNEELVTPDDLFILFGVYGNVHRVKILYNKKSNALIQMAETQQAQLSMSHLDRIKLYGRQIRINFSKHQSVPMPREGEEDPNLNKDYSTSQLHRFKKPGSKNSHNIYPPSATLHLSNIPHDITEDDIKEAFSSTGGSVKAFRFFPKDHKMAQIQMGSVEEAVAALIKMHTYLIDDNCHLKVSFSKSAI